MYGEYLNMVINMSADEFFDMMWNQKNEIYQDILEYEEVFDFAWRKFQSQWCTAQLKGDGLLTTFSSCGPPTFIPWAIHY